MKFICKTCEKEIKDITKHARDTGHTEFENEGMDNQIRQKIIRTSPSNSFKASPERGTTYDSKEAIYFKRKKPLEIKKLKEEYENDR